MGLGCVRERERAIEHWFERARGESAEQVGGETLTADQCLLQGARTEGDANDARAFARHLP